MRRSTVLKSLVAAAFAGGLALGAAAPGYADGDGDPSSCQDGENCNAVPNRSDREIYNAGYLLAQAGHYNEAVQMLRRAQDQNHPAILNYIGFSTRHLGDVDGALVYYKKALKINPEFTLARAYMGEAYLQKADPASAKEQLTQIEKRCGTNCEEFAKLAKAIALYEAKLQG